MISLLGAGQTKEAFDPDNITNPTKIVDISAMKKKENCNDCETGLVR
jgi:hypothetical protein